MRCEMNKAFKSIASVATKFGAKETLGIAYSSMALVAATLDVWIKYQRCKELEEKKQKSKKIGF